MGSFAICHLLYALVAYRSPFQPNSLKPDPVFLRSTSRKGIYLYFNHWMCPHFMPLCSFSVSGKNSLPYRRQFPLVKNLSPAWLL